MDNPRILIVDDEAAILFLLEQGFTRAGFEVIKADSGEKALEILDSQPARIMFLDLNLPEMDGVELCREIKKIMPMSVVYALTGYASLFELSDCLDAGFDDYFKKPVNLSTLVQAAQAAHEKISRWKKI
jgi:DNA-binding response OmpR family regulator